MSFTLPELPYARDALVETVRRVHAGQTYLPPQLAAKLAERVSGEVLSPREIDVLQRMARQIRVPSRSVLRHQEGVLLGYPGNVRRTVAG